MNKRDQIAVLKRTMAAAKSMKEVSEQNYNIAARLESEAKSALDSLGAKPERAREGLPVEMKLQMMANMTSRSRRQ